MHQEAFARAQVNLDMLQSGGCNSTDQTVAAEALARLEHQQAAIDDNNARLVDQELGLAPPPASKDSHGCTDMWGGIDFDIVPDVEDLTEKAFAHAKYGDKFKLDQLLADGHDVNARNELSHTLMMEAAIHNHKNILKLLHSYGADVNQQDNLNNSALHYACQYKHDKLAEYMVAKLGADDSLLNDQGYDCYLWGELN
eukprot:FR738738.1.p1 GENE.FR738738.1~~FR738738.1.p1  ORF type:complete len:198 (+),score=19.84 FR738738.1:2-595(+)